MNDQLESLSLTDVGGAMTVASFRLIPNGLEVNLLQLGGPAGHSVQGTVTCTDTAGMFDTLFDVGEKITPTCPVGFPRDGASVTINAPMTNTRCVMPAQCRVTGCSSG